MTPELHLFFLFLTSMVIVAFPAAMIIIAPIWIVLTWMDERSGNVRT